jgi:hypothetical protein
MSLRLSFLGLLAGLIAVSAVRADDFFEQKKKEQALQAQQSIADVTTALNSSRELEKTDAAKAKAILTKALDDLADARSLDARQYKDLNDKLLARLAHVEDTLSAQKKNAASTSKLNADKEAQAEKERQIKDKLAGGGKSSYDQAKDRIDGTKKTLETQSSLNKMKEKGITDVTLDIYKSASRMTEERITQYFIDKSEKRKANKLTKDEVAILKALNSTMKADFDKVSVKEFLQYMQDKVPGLTIFVDEASRKDVDPDNVLYDTPITFKAAKVSVRTLLKKVFSDLGLTYVIKDAAIQVITPDRAKDYVVARAYPVQDLVAPFDMRWGMYANKAQMFQQAQLLMAMIVNTIEPQSWAGNSERGFGTISYDPVTMAIVVRHTAEMHYQLGGGLAR